MKSGILLTVMLLVQSILNAQSIQNGHAVYNFTHIRDTSNRTNVYTEDMKLCFNMKYSSYFSYTKYYVDSILQAKMKIIESGGRISQEEFKAVSQTAAHFRITTTENLYFNFEEGKSLFVHPWIGETLGIEYKTDLIKWELTDSTKMIEGLECLKAFCRFKGRNYEVWYCPTIPTKAGPWKLNGLPGLIVQAKDTSGTISFNLKSLFFSDINSNLIAPPAQFRKVSQDQFAKLKIGLLQNPQAYVNAAVSGSSISTPNEKTEVRKTTTSGQNQKSKLNNPIELHNE